MTKLLSIFLVLCTGHLFSQKVNDNKILLTKTDWFTTHNFLFCKGDQSLQKDSSSLNPVKVVFTDSGQLIVWQDQIKHVKKYKLNSNYIELNLSDTSTHGIIMYCYYKLITADNSVNLIGIDKKDFGKSNNK